MNEIDLLKKYPEIVYKIQEFGRLTYAEKLHQNAEPILEYYFDKDMNEVCYKSFVGFDFSTKGRKWDLTFLNKSKIIKLD